MRILVGAAGCVLIVVLLAEFFVTFMLPRRVKRDPRIARELYRLAWTPWQAIARRFSAPAQDTMLGLFGPLGLLMELALWTLGLMLGWACLHWALGSRLSATGPTTFADDAYFSAATFVSAGSDLAAHGTAPRIVSLLEAATGVGVLFIVIGYLPSVYGAFSRREVAVSQLDARAGSPPSVESLVRRLAERDGVTQLDAYFRDWEGWAAELMETHLSYPILGYYRSQHVNQNWLATLTTITDTAALLVAGVPAASSEAAELAFAIGRHALSDLSHSYRASPAGAAPRLDEAGLATLRGLLGEGGLPLVPESEHRARLDGLRARYEPQAAALSAALALDLPGWMTGENSTPNWRRRI